MSLAVPARLLAPPGKTAHNNTTHRAPERGRTRTQGVEMHRQGMEMHTQEISGTTAAGSRPGNTAPLPLPEYPRPQLVRAQYEILNGLWDYAITPAGRRPGTYEGKILVPFSPETRRSGVQRILRPGETLHYRRTFLLEEIPAHRRLLLQFGAVDERCEVFVNGRRVGGHRGGYLAFSCDATQAVHTGENVLTVEVQDDSDTSFHARGKQKLSPGGMFYRSQSGIWKTVWYEWVPERYVGRLEVVPQPERGGISLTVVMDGGDAREASVRIFPEADAGEMQEVPAEASGEASAEAGAGTAGGFVSVPTGEAVFLPVPDAHLWSPEDPFLYRIEVRAGEDRVQGYCAMRTFSKGKDAGGRMRFLLNGKPYFMHGLLDQGYWPESLMTPPSEEAMRFDILEAKKLGFNMLRKHVKVDPARWYRLCDELGMLVWQDAVNGGTAYSSNLTTNLPNILPAVQTRIDDSTERGHRLLSRSDAAGRAEFEEQLREMVRELRPFGCICAWVPFNEGWGQFDSVRIARQLQAEDPSRLVDAASGWFDRGGGDFYSIHNYFRKLKVDGPKAAQRICALTEYGGLSRPVEGRTQANGMKVYRSLRTEEALTDAFVQLVRRDILPRIPEGLSGAVYTQISDVEGEINGLFTYDRCQCKMDAARVAALRREIDAAWRDVRMPGQTGGRQKSGR